MLTSPLPQINKIKKKERKKEKSTCDQPSLLEKYLTMVVLEKEVALG